VFGVSETPFDLRFRLFHAPVRITGWFWLGAILLGGNRSPAAALTWVACMLISLLVHEFGHGLMARLFGHHFEVTLHAMGGLCSYESGRDSTARRLAVLAAGPGAQLLFLLLIVLGGQALLGVSLGDSTALALNDLGISLPFSGIMDPLPVLRPYQSTLAYAYESLLFINFMWPLLNLLPIWPLDGGQMACEVWGHIDRRDGRRRAHILSLITSGLIVFYVLYSARGKMGEATMYRAIFFGFFAFVNYQMLQAYQARYRMYGSDEDRDWR
jgi:Zn-dependent protease